MAEQKRRVSFRSDRAPQLNEETDAFGHLDYVTSLYRTASEVDSHSTVGLFAQWGTGKSAILEEVARRVNDDQQDSAAVVLDVWRYEEDASLRREFVRGLGEQLKEADHGNSIHRSFDLDEHLSRFDADEVHFKPQLKPNWRAMPLALAYGFVVGVALVCLLLVLPEVGLITEKTAKQLLRGGIGAGLLAFFLSAVAQGVRIEQIQVSRKRLQDSDEFARSFGVLLKQGLKPKRLVVGIDNLDRCSPERVTEMLATIKTFLEPADTGKDLVFLIAADDAALRRHLIAQEIATSAGSPAASSVAKEGTQPPGDPVPDEVREAVDEYLRKFFSGVVRINDLLDADIRDFTTGELADFVEAHQLDGDGAGSLVEMVASALKQNPRRIKQFINGLELRMQLLDDRRAAKRITIDPDVLVVAKLSIIEEQYPAKFHELRANPRLLDRWHHDAFEEVENEPQAERAWKQFLRNSQPISSPNLGVYLDLKQSDAEVSLPRFGAFAEALEAGELRAVNGMFDEAEVAEHAEGYRKQLKPLLRRAVTRRWWGSATQIVRATLEVAELQAEAPAIVTEALLEPTLRGRLAEIPPKPLLSGASRLDQPLFNQVAGLAISRFGEDTDIRAAISPELVRHYDKLSDNTLELVQPFLRGEEVRRDFSSYVELAERAPRLLPREQTIIDGFAAMEAQMLIAPTDPPYRVLKALFPLDEPVSPPEAGRFVELINRSLLACAEQGDQANFATLALDATEVVRGLRVGLVEELRPAMEQLHNQWAPIGAGNYGPALLYAAALMETGPAELAGVYAADLVAAYFSADLLEAMDWFAQQNGLMPESLGPPVLEHMALAISGGSSPDAQREGHRILTQLADIPRSVLLERSVQQGFDQGRLEPVVELINQFAGDVENLDQAIDRLLQIREDLPQEDQPQALMAIAQLNAAVLNAGYAARRRQVLINAALLQHSTWLEAFQAVEPHDGDLAPQAVSALFDQVSADGANIGAYLPRVSFILSHRDHLGWSKTEQLGLLLLTALDQTVPAGQDPAPLANLLAQFKGIDTGPREQWVMRMIAVERQHGDVDSKRAILAAAGRLAGHPTSNAYARLKERLDELADSNETEQNLANLVRDEI